MNNDQSGPTSQDQPVMQPEQTSAPVPGKSKKKLLLLILLLLVIAAAALYLFVFKQADEKPAAGNQSAQSQQSADTDHRFYYTELPDTVVFYSPGNNDSESVKLSLNNDRVLLSHVSYTNQSVQVSDDGKSIFYLSGTPKPGVWHVEPELENTIISVFKDGQETKLVELSAEGGQGIDDWVISPDGAVLYYLVTTANKGNLNLRMLTLESKEDVLVKAGVLEPGTRLNPMFVTAEGDLFMYISPNYTLTEHKVQDGKYSTRELGPLGCDCMLEYPQAISPDGTKLLLEEQTSGEDPSDFIYYIRDIASGKLTEIGRPETNLQRVAGLWSPDSKQLAFDTAWFGNAPDTFSLRAVLLDLESAQTVDIYQGTDSADRVTVLGWSPDGRYLAFTHGEQSIVKFYDIANKSVIGNTLNAANITSSDHSYGWL